MHVEDITNYLGQAVTELLRQGHFDNGLPFRPTQKEALEAFDLRLRDPAISRSEAVTGFFDIPGGIGKTALFVGIVSNAYLAAQMDDQEMSIGIIVPSTTILEQTQNAFYEFSPYMRDLIGVYGDGQKDLHQPIKIIMDVEWAKLTRQGEIGPHNIDALFVDEAHSETSDYRREEIYSFYEDKTALLGFTATPDYDEQKSVLQTHKNRIYSKTLPEAVKGGELASYIQAYAYEVRVEPPTKNHLHALFNDEAISSGWYKRKLKQTAWSNTAVQIYKQGTDKITGDLLSDNPTAFFTDDTQHADALAAMLNADPVLQQRALDKGYKGVAVAIHTVGMSRKAQKEAFKAFENGDVMAVVGDEKFKEGYDYPPLKTVFDYQHGSLVDKLQILMRGARQFEDKGLTFIDPIIYIGSGDRRKDALARREAIRKAVTAHDILGSSFILGPHIPSRKQKKGGKPEYIFKNDGNIKEYISAKDYTILMSERELLRRENEEPITEEVFAKLKEEAERTGLWGAAIFNRISSPPEDLNLHRAQNMVSGSIKNASPAEITALLGAYVQQPDQKRIPISKEDVIKLQAEQKRTGLGAVAIFELIENPPEGASVHLVNGILTWKSKKAPPEFMAALLTTYAQQPDQKQMPISKEDFEKLKAEEKRTGLGGTAIFNRITSPLEDTNLSLVYHIIAGAIKNASPELITTLLDTYAQQPDQKQILISKEVFEKLKAEEKRTGLGGTAIFNRIKAPPKDTNEKMAAKIVNGKQKKAPPELITVLLDAYAQQPDAETEPEKKPISVEDFAKLKAEKERTGLGGRAIFKCIAKPPEDLNPQRAHNIVSSSIKSASPAAIIALLNTYAQQPDHQLVSKEVFEKLKAEEKRTGLGGKAIFNRIENPQEDLNPRRAQEIVYGTLKNAPSELITALLDAYAQQPSKVSDNDNNQMLPSVEPSSFS